MVGLIIHHKNKEVQYHIITHPWRAWFCREGDTAGWHGDPILSEALPPSNMSWTYSRMCWMSSMKLFTLLVYSKKLTQNKLSQTWLSILLCRSPYHSPPRTPHYSYAGTHHYFGFVLFSLWHLHSTLVSWSWSPCFTCHKLELQVLTEWHHIEVANLNIYTNFQDFSIFNHTKKKQPNDNISTSDNHESNTISINIFMNMNMHEQHL